MKFLDIKQLRNDDSIVLVYYQLSNEMEIIMHVMIIYYKMNVFSVLEVKKSSQMLDNSIYKNK